MRHAAPDTMRAVDLRALRRELIMALAGDPELFEQLVLKGGNALALVHGIGLRASVDLDYSMEREAADADALGRRIFEALRGRLAALGLVVFDERFAPRPRRPAGVEQQAWGGYTAAFKLIARERYEALIGAAEQIRRESLSVTGEPQAGRNFRIEISTFEYCEGKACEDLEGGSRCYVYTPAMIAAEKLRSLCQQMGEYGRRAHTAPRARDFYDLHALLTEGRVELSEDATHQLVRAVFDVKKVPTRLLAHVEEYREYHRSDWAAVLNAIPSGRPRLYDFYVDFVIAEVRKLQPLWVVDTP